MLCSLAGALPSLRTTVLRVNAGNRRPLIPWNEATIQSCARLVAAKPKLASIFSTPVGGRGGGAHPPCPLFSAPTTREVVWEVEGKWKGQWYDRSLLWPILFPAVPGVLQPGRRRGLRPRHRRRGRPPPAVPGGGRGALPVVPEPRPVLTPCAVRQRRSPPPGKASLGPEGPAVSNAHVHF